MHYIHVHTHVHTHTNTYIHTQAYINPGTYTSCIHTYMYIHTYTHVQSFCTHNVHTDIHAYVRAYTHTHTHTHTHTNTWHTHKLAIATLWGYPGFVLIIIGIWKFCDILAINNNCIASIWFYIDMAPGSYVRLVHLCFLCVNARGYNVCSSTVFFIFFSLSRNSLSLSFSAISPFSSQFIINWVLSIKFLSFLQ